MNGDVRELMLFTNGFVLSTVDVDQLVGKLLEKIEEPSPEQAGDDESSCENNSIDLEESCGGEFAELRLV